MRQRRQEEKKTPVPEMSVLLTKGKATLFINRLPTTHPGQDIYSHHNTLEGVSTGVGSEHLLSCCGAVVEEVTVLYYIQG